MKIKYLLLALLVSFGFSSAQAQKQYASYCVGFYNVENLFDTEDDVNNPGDDEYLPDGPNKWTQDKYEKKLDNIAKVISRLGRDYTPAGPAILGVAEVENRRVLEDLVKNPQIANVGYEIVHYESPDWRGIDVALIYNPKLFRVTNSVAHPYVLPENPDFRTRDLLVVSGMLADEPLHVIVGHWPSRFGGGKSSPLREQAARITLSLVDSLQAINPDAKVVIMGDFNDDPNNKSTRVVLNAKKFPSEVKPLGLYNTMWKLYDQGIGSLAYQGKWNLFDQIIISESLLSANPTTLKFWKAEVFNKDFLITSEGKRKGYPFRTFDGNNFINGYSDHLPTMIFLLKELK